MPIICYLFITNASMFLDSGSENGFAPLKYPLHPAALAPPELFQWKSKLRFRSIPKHVSTGVLPLKHLTIVFLNTSFGYDLQNAILLIERQSLCHWQNLFFLHNLSLERLHSYPSGFARGRMYQSNLSMRWRFENLFFLSSSNFRSK